MNAPVTAIRVPKGSANDETLRIVAFHAVDGQPLAAAQVVCEVEGAKAVIEVESPSAGIFHAAAAAGDQLPVGALIGVVAPEGIDRTDALAGIGDPAPEPEPRMPAADGTRFSRSAAALIAERGLDPARFAGRGLVTAAMIEEAGEPEEIPAIPAPGSPWPLIRQGGGENGRVLVVGAGSGAHQMLSVLLVDAGTEVVGLLDDDPAKADTVVLGVPVIGRVADIHRLAGEGRADSIIVATSRNPSFRWRVADAARAAGLALANAVHPKAVFDAGAAMGGGDYVGPFCYLGAATRIGDMCHLSSRTTFEHHNRVGSGVTTGPNVATSGEVTIGDNVRFGAGIAIEPGLRIGDGAVIASGVAVTADVPANAIMKGRVRGPYMEFRALQRPTRKESPN